MASESAEGDTSSCMFVIPEPIEQERFVQLSEQILTRAILLFSPFGLSDDEQAEYSEAEFRDIYVGRFRPLLEMVSQSLYKEQGLTDGDIAITVHKFVDELRSPDAIDAVRALEQGAAVLRRPPKVVELPDDFDLVAVSRAAEAEHDRFPKYSAHADGERRELGRTRR